MSGCQLVVFNQVHTEVSPMRLVKEGKKKREKSLAQCPEIWGLRAGCFRKKKHAIRDCDMNSQLNCWNIYLSYKNIISFLHCNFNRLLSLS